MDLLGLGLIQINGWLLLVFVTTAIYYYYITKFQYFRKMGIKGPKPYPFIGSILPMFTKGLVYMDKELTDKYGDIVGIYEGACPVLVVKDREIVKQILVKESQHFLNRRVISSGIKQTELMMTALKDNKWKTVRSVVSPTFSTGKLRMMTKQINECARLLVENLATVTVGDEPFEFKHYAGCFTMDVIARIAFGLQVNSQKEKENVFVSQAKKGFSGNKRRNPGVLIALFLPFLRPILRKIGISVLPNDVIEFFAKVSGNTMDNREQSNQSYPIDFMQLMMNSHKEITKKKKVPTATLR